MKEELHGNDSVVGGLVNSSEAENGIVSVTAASSIRNTEGRGKVRDDDSNLST